MNEALRQSYANVVETENTYYVQGSSRSLVFFVCIYLLCLVILNNEEI